MFSGESDRVFVVLMADTIVMHLHPGGDLPHIGQDIAMRNRPVI